MERPSGGPANEAQQTRSALTPTAAALAAVSDDEAWAATASRTHPWPTLRAARGVDMIVVIDRLGNPVHARRGWLPGDCVRELLYAAESHRAAAFLCVDESGTVSHVLGGGMTFRLSSDHTTHDDIGIGMLFTVLLAGPCGVALRATRLLWPRRFVTPGLVSEGRGYVS